MKFLRFVLFVLAACTSSVASAAPIQLYGGTLDATLRFFDYQHTDDYSSGFRILREEYELGVDFIAAVPLSNQQNLVPYTGCVQATGPNTAFLGPCGAQAAALTSVPSINDYSDDPAQLTPLADGCSPPYNYTGKIVMVLRGNCSFSERWQELEGAGYLGVLVENNGPGLLAGLGLVPVPAGTTEPTIPFFLITAEVADELRSGSRGYNLSFQGDGHRYLPILQMRVTWTPTIPDIGPPPFDPEIDSSDGRPDAVPEPGTLALMMLGIACVRYRHSNSRRRTQ
jgi:hypothetical protein